MLKQRIITALILIPITVLILFYLPPTAFCFLTAFITLGGAWEWSRLMGLERTPARFLYLAVMVATFFLVLFIPVLFIFTAAVIWWVVACLLMVAYTKGNTLKLNSWFLRGIMGLLVLAPCWAAINYIRSQPDGVYALLFLFVLIWGADSAAYFAGKKWGKHKLAPSISPGKTWQGLAGAMAFSILFVLGVLLFTHVPTALWPWCFFLAIVTVSFSIVGDLFESMLKRITGVKDSGQLLPGHGGLLDRIDSLTAAAPVFVLGSLLLGMYFN